MRHVWLAKHAAEAQDEIIVLISAGGVGDRPDGRDLRERLRWGYASERVWKNQ